MSCAGQRVERLPPLRSLINGDEWGIQNNDNTKINEVMIQSSQTNGEVPKRTSARRQVSPCVIHPLPHTAA